MPDMTAIFSWGTPHRQMFKVQKAGAEWQLCVNSVTHDYGSKMCFPNLRALVRYVYINAMTFFIDLDTLYELAKIAYVTEPEGGSIGHTNHNTGIEVSLQH